MTDFNKDHYRTPRKVIDYLMWRYGWFHLDGCARGDDSVTARYIGKPDENSENVSIAPDFLMPLNELQDLLLNEMAVRCSNLRIFVNPPYSNVAPFLKRAKELRDLGHFVVMLLNNDKSTQWYQNYVYNVANEVIDIVGGRINFLHPITGEECKGNSKGQMFVVFDPTIDDFVTRSVTLANIKQIGGK